VLCQECRKRQATVHKTVIINDHKTETHLCESCARQHAELDLGAEAKFSINSLLAGLLEHEGPALAVPSVTRLKCPECGQTYAQFARAGRLGCGTCYTAFQERLDPLVRRIHGAPAHTGKIPRRALGAVRLRREIVSLKRELQEAVEREDFERAARLRDRIRELETRQ